MEDGEDGRRPLPKDKIIQIYSDFMIRIAKFEELATVGSKLLVAFHQALGFLGRPPIDKTSALVERLIKAHGTRRFQSYIEAGCMNTHDSVQNVNKLHTCHLGLKDHTNQAKIIVGELECLLEDAASVVRNANEQDEDINCNLDSQDEDINCNLDSFIVINGIEKASSSDPSKPEVTDYGSTMAIIYSMVKQDYTMQDRIISSLKLKSSAEELETYCQMWSLRPFVDDEIMHKAWSLVPSQPSQSILISSNIKKLLL